PHLGQFPQGLDREDARGRAAARLAHRVRTVREPLAVARHLPVGNGAPTGPAAVHAVNPSAINAAACTALNSSSLNTPKLSAAPRRAAFLPFCPPPYLLTRFASCSEVAGPEGSEPFAPSPFASGSSSGPAPPSS